ncbi:MAG TPA: electron transfer flavoprotein subunit alpha/FixB family protein [Bacteroidales bacterium]|nr:electron transfer flavoprotein subunit alpha/FixB family protein [Bacteroidales bacterium]
MKNVFVYCEVNEERTIADVSLELLSKGHKLAQQLGVKLEAVVLGDGIEDLAPLIMPFGADVIHLADSPGLYPYRTLPHAAVVEHIFRQEKPEIALFGASPVGRDLAPRIASALRCGLTADCTSLEIGDHHEKKTETTYKDLLYQIRPAFGGNIIATIINPDTRPQMATVREGVMKKEVVDPAHKAEVRHLDLEGIISPETAAIEIIERHVEQSRINIKNSGIIIAGGYGVGSKENFKLLHDLAEIIGAEVGASRAAVDAGFAEHERQIGQTGVTVRPKLYIACGISGAVQHRAGMDQSAQIISINTDPHAPINHIADYTINGRVEDVIPKMIRFYKKNIR